MDKLRADSLKLCEKHGVDGTYLCIGISAGMLFNPEGDDSSIELSSFVKDNGVEKALKEYSDYSGKYTGLISTLYEKVKKGESLDTVVKYVDEINGKEIRV